jgi:hypothetical protein
MDTKENLDGQLAASGPGPPGHTPLHVFPDEFTGNARAQTSHKYPELMRHNVRKIWHYEYLYKIRGFTVKY